MRLIVGLICVAVIALSLAEFFVVFLLPRRVKRDPRIARRVLTNVWLPYRALATRLRPAAADTMLGIFGPLGLLTILGALSVGVIAAFTGLYWADSTHFGVPHGGDFGDDLYFSGGAFLSASTPLGPTSGLGKTLQVLEAGTGFGFLAIAIGYLPALFQSFSRRETAVSRLDPRAGSPPSAGALLERSGRRGGWTELDAYLREWETWTAELMETHLSYPILAYFRSQHVNQNWLAALTTVVDACAYAMAYGPEEAVEASSLTFAIGRHALADLAHSIVRTDEDEQLLSRWRDRLTPDSLAELNRRLEGSGLHAEPSERAAAQLEQLRNGYEPNAIALSDWLALRLPGWLPGEDVPENWRVAHRRSEGHLP